MGIVQALLDGSGTTCMKTLTMTAALLGALFATPVLAAQYHKWTDENGLTHYSDTPPPVTAKNTAEVKVQTKLPSGSATATEQLQKQREAASKNLSDQNKTTAQEASTAAKVDKSEYAERCQQYKSNLEAMESHGRVTETDSKGEKRVLTDDEKNKRMDETRRQIKAFCE